MAALDGKVAVITGGASGFGRAASTLWAKEGAAVMVADLDAQGGNEVVEEVKGAGGNASFVKTDVTNAKEVAAMVAKTVQTFGALNLLYNNAGILGDRGVPLTKFDDKVAERLLAVNIMGTYLPTKHAIPAMLKAGGGAIVSTGSDSAFRGNAPFAMYGATKGAVICFARVVAIEYASKNIRSNTVSPGVGRTPMHAEELAKNPKGFAEVEQMIPLKRAAEPLDVARAALFLASDASSYITGANIMVDGGWTARGYF